jgi:hypothetical protein
MGNSSLMLAVGVNISNGSTKQGWAEAEVVAALIVAGANPNAQNKVRNRGNHTRAMK